VDTLYLYQSEAVEIAIVI